MNCKDCIHSGVCYKKNDYENFPDRCGEFIFDKVLEEQSQGEWIILDRNDRFNIGNYKCNLCGYRYPVPDELSKNYCPNCGADMRGKKNEQ